MRTPAEILQWRDGYDVGYREGGGNEEATLSIMLDDLDLPEGVIEVDFGDILKILSTWDDVGGPNDIDDSGVVDFGDILRILSSWGELCP